MKAGPAGRPVPHGARVPRSGTPAVVALATRAIFLALATLLAVACRGPDSRARGDEPDGAPQDDRPAATRQAAGDSGWVVLFDGTDLSAWRGYRRPDVPPGWRIRGGTLALVPGDEDGEGGDLVTRDAWGDFELDLSWRIGPGGNSGIFYRATEDADYIWQSAPEMQVLDDDRHPDGQDPVTSAGSVFALYPPVADVVNPAGRWNEVRIIARGSHVEHWLNGVKIVEYEMGSEDWNDRVAASKFAAYAGFGEARRGVIGLQDHGDPVTFRRIRIRPLDAPGR